ncbi:hypothetical protein PIB30_089144 [Stylosanthes scabra]|uniref:Uncharacterized protein n=1 Tax=Stylosanthes scabra TaxID=79078 RepID=A0ABU6VTQ1_9FABA|nr:hypothetical protein [Stylosanthes scabra]
MSTHSKENALVSSEGLNNHRPQPPTIPSPSASLLTPPPLLSSISHRRPLPPRVTTPPRCLDEATHSHHHSSLSISSTTAAIHEPPRRSLNRVIHHHLQKPPNTAAIFPLSQLRQPPNEPLSSETHTPPYSAPFPSLFLASPSSRLSAPGKPLLLYTFTASVTTGVTPVRRPCSVNYHPPPSCISPPASIITGGMVRKGKALVKAATSAAAGSTAGKPSLPLNDTYFDTTCQNYAGKFVGRGIICERPLKFPEAIPDLVCQKIEKQAWNFLYNDTIPVNTTLVREFCSNFDQLKQIEVYMRGKMVPFTLAVIHDILEIPRLNIRGKDDLQKALD